MKFTVLEDHFFFVTNIIYLFVCSMPKSRDKRRGNIVVSLYDLEDPSLVIIAMHDVCLNRVPG